MLIVGTRYSETFSPCLVIAHTKYKLLILLKPVGVVTMYKQLDEEKNILILLID